MPRALLLLALVLFVSACDSASEPEIASVDGTWPGVAILPNGFSASANLTQQGRAVGGTMRVSGFFLSAPVVAEIDDLGRLAWEVQDGCER